MRIGVDIRSLNTKHLTGVGHYSLHILEELARQDKNNQYFLLSSGCKAGDNHFLPKSDNFNYHHIKQANKWLNFNFILGRGKDFSMVGDRGVDIFWLPNINFLKINAKTPLIITIHDLSWLQNKAFYDYKRIWWHRLVGVKRLLQRADHIIAVSHNTKRDLIRFFNLPADKISVVYSGISAVVMDQERAKRELAGSSLPDKYFLYLGTLEPRKNIISIIQAFAMFHNDQPDYHLLIVGGRGWAYKNILQAIKDKPYIHYLNYLSSPKKDALYFLSQGLIWPSFYEGFGFPPLEAISQGAPVITSYKSSLPEVLGQAALYVDPYNVADIYQALKLITDNSDLRQQLYDSGQKILKPTWSATAQEMIKIFEKIKRYENSN
ncbi:MAG: glycosyltransferase family 1 protein [Patescibacteria group bacterium]